MGGEMGGSTQLNPAVIGGLPHPDDLSTGERSGLPEANMPSVCDISGGLFKRQILGSPKDIQLTDRGCRVAFVRETIHGYFCGCLWGNRIRNQPPGLVKAVQDLILTPDKDEIDGVSCCFCVRL